MFTVRCHIIEFSHIYVATLNVSTYCVANTIVINYTYWRDLLNSNLWNTGYWLRNNIVTARGRSVGWYDSWAAVCRLEGVLPLHGSSRSFHVANVYHDWGTVPGQSLYFGSSSAPSNEITNTMHLVTSLLMTWTQAFVFSRQKSE